MSDHLRNRYATRTADKPMGFTAWELIRGAVFAWVGFVSLAPGIVVGVVLLPGVPQIGDGSFLGPASSAITTIYFSALAAFTQFLPWSFGALIVLGLPLAALLGFTLNRVTSKPIHLTLFAALGALVGAVTTLIYYSASAFGFGGTENGFALILAANTCVTAVTVALGWLFTSQRALDADEQKTSSVQGISQ